MFLQHDTTLPCVSVLSLLHLLKSLTLDFKLQVAYNLLLMQLVLNSAEQPWLHLCSTSVAAV